MHKAFFTVYVVAAMVLFGPWLAKEREVVEGTPAHPPLYQAVPVEVPLGGQICVEPITLTDDTRRIRFGILGEGPSRVVVIARGRGYESRRTVRADGRGVDAWIEPPPRDLEGEVCFRNPGAGSLPLLGSSDPRILGRADPTVGGERLSTTEVAVTLLRARPASIGSRGSELFANADVLAPGFAGEWLYWLLVPLVAVGIPAGALAALAAASKPEDREQERREEDLDADDHQR